MEYRTLEGDPGNLCLILAMKSLSELGEQVSEAKVAGLAKHILEAWEHTFVDLYRQGGWKYARSLRDLASVLGSFSLQIVAPILMRLQQYDPHIQPSYPIPTASGVIDLPVHLLWYLFQDTPVSFSAAHTLRVLQTPAVITRLLALLEDTQGNWSLEDRVTVVKLLGKMGEHTPVSFLVQAWQDTTLHDDLRRSAAKSLSETEVPVPPDNFIAMLNDSHASILGIAIEALGKRNGEGRYTDLLIAGLQGSDCYVRERALCCCITSPKSYPGLPR